METKNNKIKTNMVKTSLFLHLASCYYNLYPYDHIRLYIINNPAML